MDTLSLVSMYLNGMEDILDNGDSIEARKLTIKKSKVELELFEALDHKSVVVNEGGHRVVVFKKEPPRAYIRPFTIFSLPCDVDGQGAWDAELDMADLFNYITEERFDQLGFVHVDYGKYGRKMVKEVQVEIYGFTFLVDFVVIFYTNEGEPSVLFGRDFLETDAMLDSLVENLDEVGSSNGDLVKMGKASRNKNHKVNILTPSPQIKIEEIPTTSTISPPSPIYHPLTQKQKEKVKEMLDHKYKELEDPKPYNSNLTMADNTQAKAMGEVKNVRIQIGYQAYLVDFLILDIPMDKELSLLLGRLFLRTCGAVIDMGHEEDNWLSCFEVGRDEDGNPKYGHVAPSFLDIEDDMERALAMKAYFNPFKKIIVFKKLIDFLAKQSSCPNPFIANFEKRNKHGTIKYHLQQVKNINLKWRELSSERQDYCERLSKLQGKEFGIPRVLSWILFYTYNIEETLKNNMKYEYLHDDGDVYIDYSWERALSIYGDVYPESCLEFFSMMYFDRGVDRTKLMTEKCIWFRHCRVEKVVTLPEFAVLLGLYEEDELSHRLFAIHFTRLVVDDKLFNHEAFWQKIGQLTSTNPRTLLIKEPLMRIVHRLLSWRINLAWVIAEHLCKHARGLKENSLICGGHYVTKISHSLGYLNDEEVAKCSELIECETCTIKMLANELDKGTHSLMQTKHEAPQPGQARRQSQEPRGSGYEIGGSLVGFPGDDFDPIVHLEDCVESDDDEMRH
ncbi:zinc finger, CCHC-type containing protein [Tanacetum coccineum]